MEEMSRVEERRDMEERRGVEEGLEERSDVEEKRKERRGVERWLSQPDAGQSEAASKSEAGAGRDGRVEEKAAHRREVAR